MPLVAQPGLTKVRAPISQNVKRLDGKHTEPAGLIRQLQRAFEGIAAINVPRPAMQICLDRGLDLELSPINAVCQGQIGSLQARITVRVSESVVAPGS